MFAELVVALLTACAGIALLILALSVATVFLTQRFLLEAEIFPMDFAVDPEIPGDQLQRATTKLIQNGLSPAGDYGIRLMPKAHVCSRLFTDEQGTIMGHLSMIKVKGTRTLALEFSSTYTDGTAVNTKNISSPPVFKYPESIHRFQYPMCDEAELLELHRKHVATLGQGRTFREKPSNLAQYIPEGTRNELETQVSYGILKRDTTAGCYRPTLYGALRMIFRYWLSTIFRFNPEASSAKTLRQPRDKSYKTRYDQPFVYLRLVFLVMLLTGLFLFRKGPGDTFPQMLFRMCVVLVGIVGLGVVELLAYVAKKDR